jgi:hypothetical protein
MRYLITFLVLFQVVNSFGQVTNDVISNRIILSLNDKWFSSSTRNANVEWDCINKSLTSTCLVYHNDQWFTIVPPTTGTYFVNISNQRCSNQQGVQIVVLEGDPCKVDSYQLKMCIAYTDQSDMFVQIDSLIGGKEYLLNIDGYLGDQCEFNIQFSTKNLGIPVQAKNLKYIELRVLPRDSVVSVQWHIPDSLHYRLNQVSLFRKHEKEKSAVPVNKSALQRNAYGETETIYKVQDTLRRNGQYTYSIYGHTVDERVMLLARENYNYRMKGKGPRLSYRADIDFVSPKAGHVNVAVFDDIQEKQLFTTTRRAQKGKNTLELDLSDYVSDGIALYKIVVSDKTFRQEVFYRVKKLPKN